MALKPLLNDMTNKAYFLSSECYNHLYYHNDYKLAFARILYISSTSKVQFYYPLICIEEIDLIVFAIHYCVRIDLLGLKK